MVNKQELRICNGLERKIPQFLNSLGFKDLKYEDERWAHIYEGFGCRSSLRIERIMDHTVEDSWKDDIFSGLEGFEVTRRDRETFLKILKKYSVDGIRFETVLTLRGIRAIPPDFAKAEDDCNGCVYIYGRWKNRWEVAIRTEQEAQKYLARLKTDISEIIRV